MGLLATDLRALANLPGTRAGRRIVAGTGIGLGLLALMSWWGTGELLAHPRLLQMVLPATGEPLVGLLGFGLGACPVAASWIGLALAQRQLFESPELNLWLAAPLPRWRPALQVLLRASFLALLWGTALAGPVVGGLLASKQAPWPAYALAPLALLVCTVPLLAALLGVQLVLVRFFAGRVLRLVLTLVSALASAGFSTWLLVGLFTAAEERLPQLAAAGAGAGRLPWTIDSAAHLLAAAAGGRCDVSALASALGWLAAALAGFVALGHLHPRAVEKHLESQPPLRRRRSGWPSSVAGAIRRKEFAQVLQQPGALLGFLAFAVLVVALARQRVLVGGLLDASRLPPDLASVAAMLVLWFVAVLLVLYAHMGRLAMWDGPQWPLYLAAPARPVAILWGKLQAVALFLLWPLVVVGAAGSQMLGAGPAAVGLFAAVALAGTVAALGVLAAVGTWPRLMRPDDAGQIVQGGRSFLAALVLVVAFELVAAPVYFGWPLLVDAPQQRLAGGAGPASLHGWAVPAIWLFALLAGASGFGLGVRNYGRLLRAR
ncbi:MAG: hypothetical protein FJ265_11255 [Planctomycetes bacterium]|nr:hypothetical protein [Planctomycetota bacterium]